MSGAGAAARVRAHLEAEYGIRVSKMSGLEQGVFRVGQQTRRRRRGQGAGRVRPRLSQVPLRR
jgi:hypothetical protein